MEPRLLILAAAFVLVVVAFAVFIGSLVRSRKHQERLPEQPSESLSELPPQESGPQAIQERTVDTDLSDLTVDIPPDSPSAALLTPIRVGNWQAPLAPADPSQLGKAPAPAVPAARKLPSEILAGVPHVVPEPVASEQPTLVWTFDGTPEVTAPEAPGEIITPAPPPAPAPRPRTHVRVSLDAPLPSSGIPSPAPAEHLPATADTPRSQAAEFTPTAPVELWFGDMRVGVRAGTKTYEQFRRYADMMLGGHKEERPPAR